LIGRLRDFFTVPDHVIAISGTEELQYQLDAAFLQVGEVRGGHRQLIGRFRQVFLLWGRRG
jgi:hypothetical protein